MINKALDYFQGWVITVYYHKRLQLSQRIKLSQALNSTLSLKCFGTFQEIAGKPENWKFPVKHNENYSFGDTGRLTTVR